MRFKEKMSSELALKKAFASNGISYSPGIILEVVGDYGQIKGQRGTYVLVSDINGNVFRINTKYLKSKPRRKKLDS